MLVHHHTSQSNWFWTANSGFNQWGELRPQTVPIDFRVRGFPAWTTQPQLFAIADTHLNSWKQKKEHWENLLMHVRHGDPILLRLSFEVSEITSVGVVDAMPRRRAGEVFKRLAHRNEQAGDHQKARDALSAYVNSRVSLESYQDNYELPELLIPFGIPLNQIKAEEVYQ